MFPLALAPCAEQVLYLRVQSTIGFIVPATLWPAEDFALYARDDYAAQAWYFGMVAAMALFNLDAACRPARPPLPHVRGVLVACVALTIASKSGWPLSFCGRSGWSEQCLVLRVYLAVAGQFFGCLRGAC